MPPSTHELVSGTPTWIKNGSFGWKVPGSLMRGPGSSRDYSLELPQIRICAS